MVNITHEYCVCVCVCKLSLFVCVSFQPTEGQRDQRPADAAGPSFLGPSGLP